MASPPKLEAIRKQVDTLGIAERFFDSVVLFALFEVGVFKALAQGHRTLPAIHMAVGGNQVSLRALLDAAVALKILSREGDGYVSPEALLDCLGRPDSTSYIGEWVAFLRALARPLLDFDGVVRTGRPVVDVEALMARDAPGDTADKSWSSLMSGGMDAYSRTRGLELAAHLDLGSAKTFLDLGAGPGTYSLAVCEHYPEIVATLVDVAGPLATARRLAAERGLSDRVVTVEADIMTFTARQPFDAILVSNTLHMLGTDAAIQLLQRCRSMLSPRGLMIVQGQLLNDDHTSPRWATLLNLIQRTVTPLGHNHSISETTDWLSKAGFVDARYVPLSLWNVNRCVTARRPA